MPERKGNFKQLHLIGLFCSWNGFIIVVSKHPSCSLEGFLDVPFLLSSHYMEYGQ